MQMTKDKRRNRSRIQAASPVVALLASLGCGNRDAPSPGDNGPSYVVSTRVSAADGTWTGYLVPLSALDGTFGLDRAIETTVGVVYGLPERGFVYHASADDPTLTRWELQADGSLAKGPVLSFANLGLATADGALSDSSSLYSSEKAYFATSGDAPEVVIWNPATMEITGTIPLDVQAQGALLPTLTTFQREDRLFVTVFWEEDFSSGDWSRFGDRARLIEIDPRTDTVVAVSEDERCNVLDRVSRAPDGTAYFSPRGFWTPVRALLGEGRGVDPCAVRIVPPDSTFDEGYALDLTSLVGGRLAGDFNVIDETRALISVWHPDLVSAPSADGSNWMDVAFEEGHLWWRWRIGAAQAEQIPDQPPGAYGGVVINAGGRKLVMSAAGDFSSSTLLELDANGRLRPVLTGPGYIWGVTRVR
jgi:hypothetical protein